MQTGNVHMAHFQLPLSPTKTKSGDDANLHAPAGSEFTIHNLLWFIRLRWIVIAVFFAAEIISFFFGSAVHDFGFQVPNYWPWSLAIILTLTNICFRVHARHLSPQTSSRSGIYLNLWTQIIVDLIALTVVVHYLGSITTFICFAYLFHTVLACIFFSSRSSLFVTFLVCLLYVGCVAAEFTGIIPPAGIYSPEVDQSLRAALTDSPFRLSIHVASALAIFLVVWYLASNLSAAVRERDRQLLIAHQRLLALDQERTQHMLHTTHELKAPFAAIQSYVQLLLKGYCGPLTEDAREVLGKIDARSQRLSNQIREMLQLANLRSASAGDFPRETVDMPDLLQKAIASAQAAAQSENISFQTDLQPACARGVPNAVQYSRPEGTVSVSCRRLQNGSAQVEIADQGIGIREDALPLIFQEYYRSKEAAEHNPRSTGLGLAIVKHIAQTHRIALRIDSQVGQGTRFTLTFPPCPRPRHLHA